MRSPASGSVSGLEILTTGPRASRYCHGPALARLGADCIGIVAAGRDADDVFCKSPVCATGARSAPDRRGPGRAQKKFEKRGPGGIDQKNPVFKKRGGLLGEMEEKPPLKRGGFLE